MTTGEYILALMAIISGLAITHLIGSASTLIEHRARVRWDWLAVTAGFYVAYIVIWGWWFSYGAFRVETASLPFYRFLMPTTNVILLALAARAILPESVPEAGVDLAEYYDRNSRFVFRCLLGCQAIAIWGTVVRLRAGADVRELIPGGVALNFAAALPIILLSTVRRRVVHAIVLPLLFAALVLTTFTKVV